MAGKGRRENLKSWEKGQSGNPGGRPKSKPFLEEIEKWIAEHPEDVTAAVSKAFEQAIKKGSIIHLKELMDRTDGPVKQAIEHSGDEALVAALLQGRKRVNSDK